jgi:hypothetical protein
MEAIMIDSLPNVEPIQVEGIKITSIQARNEPYSPGRKSRAVEKTRLFVSIKDETIIQNLLSRMVQRAGGPPRLSARDMRKHVLQRVVDRLKQDHPEARITSPSQLRWSAKAGCTMCPCSPGFIVENSFNWSIWVEVEPASAEQAT